MMPSVKVTLVVSCFNIEAHVSKCIDSICKQTFKNIEIIIIDDASTDNTLQMILHSRERDDRIVVIKNRTNTGLLQTRKQGYKKATGDFIYFVDGDDTLAIDAIDRLVSTQISSKADVIIGKMAVVKNDKIRFLKSMSGHIPGKRYLDFVIRTGQGGIVNCLIRKNKLDNTYWGSKDDLRISIGEDKLLLLQILDEKKIYLLAQPPTYFYYRHSESMTIKHRNNYNFAAERNLLNALHLLMISNNTINSRNAIEAYFISKATDYVYVSDNYTSEIYKQLYRYRKHIIFNSTLTIQQKIYSLSVLTKKRLIIQYARMIRNLFRN
jgi:glycosyltransferase involved in cell wall biosynthesis